MDHQHYALLQAVKSLEKSVAFLKSVTRSSGGNGSGVTLLKVEQDLRHIKTEIRAGANPEETWKLIQELLSRVSMLLLAQLLTERHS